MGYFYAEYPALKLTFSNDFSQTWENYQFLASEDEIWRDLSAEIKSSSDSVFYRYYFSGFSLFSSLFWRFAVFVAIRKFLWRIEQGFLKCAGNTPLIFDSISAMKCRLVSLRSIRRLVRRNLGVQFNQTRLIRNRRRLKLFVYRQAWLIALCAHDCLVSVRHSFNSTTLAEHAVHYYLVTFIAFLSKASYRLRNSSSSSIL